MKLDEIDHQILDMLIENTRTPFTDIAKKLLISAGTVHVRVKKMEDLGIIKGSSLTLDYKMLGYNFIAYVGILIDRSRRTYEIIQELDLNLKQSDQPCIIPLPNKDNLIDLEMKNIIRAKKYAPKGWEEVIKSSLKKININFVG